MRGVAAAAAVFAAAGVGAAPAATDAAGAAAAGGRAKAAPKKVAVLGTGLGSIATAWYLTNYEGWEDDWDITVYQMGFKMGGKGAATRSMGLSGRRILEHGLHIFMGWYNNAFAWIEDMYDQWKPAADCPLQTWKDAFKLSCNAGIFIHRADHANSSKPEFVPLGAPGGMLTCNDKDFEIPRGPAPSPWALYLGFLRRLEPLFAHRRGEFARLRASVEAMDGPPEGAEAAALVARIRALQQHVDGATLPPHPLATGVEGEPTPEDLAIAGKRAACVMTAIAAGTVADGMLKHGFAVQNWENAKDWLPRHGCKEPLSKNPVSRTGADLTFAYLGGKYNGDNFNAATGVALAGIMLVGHAFPLKNGTSYFTDSTFLRMQAGMSETLITPAYEVLKRRGVKFNFFHKVEELLTSDGTSVDEIKFRVQATVKAGADQYNPFFKVGGLPVTPDLEVPSACVAPECDDFFGQLAEADEIRRDDINLNSYYQGWVSGAKTVSLKAGTDYDVIVNGITAALPLVSKDLAAKNPAYDSFISTTKTDATQSVQVWFYNTTNELGCGTLSAGCSGKPGDSGSEGTLCAGAEPYDTWADMSHLLPREPANVSHTGGAPGSVQYFCAPQPFDTAAARDFSDKSVMAAAFEDAFSGAAEHLEQHTKVLFPKAFKNGNTIYDWMVAPPEAKGRDRLRHQYWRSNADPSEQYVLSPAGSIVYRPSPLGPDSLGSNNTVAGNAFGNMIIVGDIARTGVDSGCAEAAVTSGMMAAHALTDKRSPATYTSWLNQLNKTDSMHLAMGGVA